MGMWVACPALLAVLLPTSHAERVQHAPCLAPPQKALAPSCHARQPLPKRWSRRPGFGRRCHAATQCAICGGNITGGGVSSCLSAFVPLHLLAGVSPSTSPPTPSMPFSLSESVPSLGASAVALCNSARANACKRWHARRAGGVACRYLACHLSYGTRPLTRVVLPRHRTRRCESSRVVTSHHGSMPTCRCDRRWPLLVPWRR